MRLSVCAAIAAGLVYGLVSVGCDHGEVLIDEFKIDVVTDSTIRKLECIPDSTEFYIKTDAEWTLSVAKDGKWCHVSKLKGRAGRDTIKIVVDENPTKEARTTALVLVSGTNERVYKITQKAGEPWFDTMYWKRTVLQRMGMRGKVKEFSVTPSLNPNKSTIYHFDERGNLTQREYTDMEYFHMYDTTHTYTYDEANHRLSCKVCLVDGTEVRSSEYEYGNTGMFVAYSPTGWNDPDPSAEDMTGMLVPDLSSAHLIRYEGDFAYGEDREYVFENQLLKIFVVYWKKPRVGDAEAIVLSDTLMTVNYDHFKGAGDHKMLLPGYSEGHVSRISYQENGMVYKVEMQRGSYEFMKNVHKMVPLKYYSRKNNVLAHHEVDWYEVSYNFNRDPVVRRVQYQDVDFVNVDTYPQYLYDEHHNWLNREEEITLPGYEEPSFPNYVARVISYY